MQACLLRSRKEEKLSFLLMRSYQLNTTVPPRHSCRSVRQSILCCPMCFEIASIHHDIHRAEGLPTTKRGKVSKHSLPCPSPGRSSSMIFCTPLCMGEPNGRWCDRSVCREPHLVRSKSQRSLINFHGGQHTAPYHLDQVQNQR